MKRVSYQPIHKRVHRESTMATIVTHDEGTPKHSTLSVSIQQTAQQAMSFLKRAQSFSYVNKMLSPNQARRA